MNYLELNVGQNYQLFHRASDNPRWVYCFVKAVSVQGVAVGVDIKDEGHKTIWFDCAEINSNIEFRTTIDFTNYWQHHTGIYYELICVANDTENNPEYERVAVFRDPLTSEVFSRSLEIFIEEFSPVSPDFIPEFLDMLQ